MERCLQSYMAVNFIGVILLHDSFNVPTILVEKNKLELYVIFVVVLKF